MKRNAVFYAVLVLFFWGTGLAVANEKQKSDESPQVASSGAIRWYPYEEGMVRGKSEGKKIFLNFYANWCHYCKVMKDKTFTDQSVISYLNENFIAIRIDSDMQRRLARNYNVRGLPLTWFLSESGEGIGNLPGYIPPDTLLPFLKYIHTDSYKEMNFKKFKENPGR